MSVKKKNHWLSYSIRLIVHDIALLLHIPGVMALISIPICLWFGEFYAVIPFLLTAIVALIPAHLLYRWFPDTGNVQLRHAMLVVAIAWAAMSLIGTIPFLGIAYFLATSPQTAATAGEFQNIWNALFESFSGFTGTGLSVANNPSLLPHSLQWWRSLMEWVDGIGATILILAFIKPGVGGKSLFSAEGWQEKFAPTILATTRRILVIYSLYTGLSILIYAILGMPLWDAINHGLTGVATGGFSVRDESIGAYDSSIQLATLLIMITGAISFPVHNQLLKLRWSVLWQSSQHRILWLFLGLGTVVLLLEMRWFQGSFLWIDTLFQWISAVTTCGFNTSDPKNWSPAAKLFLSIGMLIGGAVDSTVGGLKLHRFLLIYQGIRWRFKQLFSEPKNNNDSTKKPNLQKIQSAAIFTVLWLVLLAFGIFSLQHFVANEYTLTDVLFEVTSATSNVGLSTGISDPNLPWGGKLTLILLMWIGRLEIIPVLLLLVSLVSLIRGKRGIN